MKSPLILVGNAIAQVPIHRTSETDDQRPRWDYGELAQRLGGTLLGCASLDAFWYRGARRLQTLAKFDLVEAAFALQRRAPDSVILSTSEKQALPLSMLAALSGQEPAHIAIAHKLSSSLKAYLFQVWPLHKSFSRVITVCQSQANYAVGHLGISETKVSCISHNVDQHFFRPLKVDEDRYILAVGREQRDYATLLEALSGTGIRLVVVTSSPWSSSISSKAEATVVSHISYRALRELYARARLVVLPLHDVDYAAGITTLLEGMAMAKPVIASRSRGILEYFADGETSVGVTPQDSVELREEILSLWDQRQRRAALGANARQAVEEKMSLDRYVERVSDIIKEVVRDG